jgi:type III secretion protein U
MSDKTEPPTPKKLRDARKKGQVAKSKEVSSAALLTVSFGMLAALLPSYIKQVGTMILAPRDFYSAEFGLAANAVLQQVVYTSLLIFGPMVAVVAVIGIIANMAQFGLMFSAEALKPKLSNLNPGKGLKKILALKNLIEFLKSVIKIAFLSELIYLIVRNSIRQLIKIPHCGLACIVPVLSNLLFQMMIYTIAAFVVVAAADYVFQKWQFTKDQKMSKEEVKKEYKESEGDPHIKGKRKQFAHELLQSNMEAGVRKSKVVVTN